MTLWLPVDLHAGLAWASGEISDGQLILAEVRRPAVFLQQMTGRISWRSLLQDARLWRHTAAVCRTDQPGLIRLLEDLGAERGFVEDSGQVRYAIGPRAFVAIESKLRRTYAPEFPSCLRGDQFPVVGKQHGLRMPRLEGSLCR